MRTRQWDHGLDRTHLQVSQRLHRRALIDNGNAIFDFGRRPHRCRRTGRGMAFETAQRREPDCSRGRHDDALVQDDGIDFVVEELGRCWEVSQDQDKASKIENALFETQTGVKMETPFMS